MKHDHPEHDKLKAVAERSQAIGEFLEFGGYTLCEVREVEGFEARYWPVGKSITQVLADYFEIDLAAIEREKRAMIEELQRGLTVP